MSNNIPEIRFKGFTHAWEQRTLGEVVDDYVERTTIQNQYPILTSSQKKGIVLQEDYFSNRQVTADENIGYFTLPRGYFTYRSRSDNDVFVFNRNDLIDKGIISYFYPVFSVRDVDSDFFLRRINNGIEHQLAVAAEGTGQHVLSLNKFKNIVAMFPALEEQIVVGSFFSTLDDTVTLYKRKLDRLKKLKNFYLQKMFPQEGESIPKVRFVGFSKPWEQRKLGEVADFSKGNGYSKGDILDKGIPIILYGRLYTNYETVIDNIDTFTELRENSVLSEGGEVIVPSSGETAEDISRASVIEKKGIILGGDLNIIKPYSIVHSIFLAITISNGNQQKELSKRAQGKSVVHIGNSDLKEVVLNLPSVKEQIAISSFFCNLDVQINIQQQKIKHFKQLKKAYLQRMLI